MEATRISPVPIDEAPETLVTGRLFKVVFDPNKPIEIGWSFKGIASDASEDTDGDEILRDMLDLDYAKTRGYVNWNHSREPEHQVGYLTNVESIEGVRRRELEDVMGVRLSKSASLYVEGELYRHVEKAQRVREILVSTPGAGYHGGLGLSLDGSLARDPHTKSLVKAFVRGVALTPFPAQPKTFCQLAKTLRGLSRETTGRMDLDEAIIWLLKQRPHWTYEVAEQVARHASANPTEGT